ncbi:hypothetical protein C490_13640 [Natronobacterium gregoryi SP2]|uniref:Uncharacterized protein n=1 Tax=Natronobacterium gregoryi (strain ATCC 43098 / DSM 3393 / CCM 3738 / CIP 104747 / IAM 13177 / JCM 8860 / NBRC 102187 / NCIMB 2189 / SP2) TaxID=797304 RepID=L9XW58_NATGS|nr:hypothetical protein C490_13640 [Natronobacterium gregoryi SP2]
MKDRQTTRLKPVLMISAELKKMIPVTVKVLLQALPVPQVLQLVLVPVVVLLQGPVLVLVSSHRKGKILKSVMKQRMVKRVRTKRSQSLNPRRSKNPISKSQMQSGKVTLRTRTKT